MTSPSSTLKMGKAHTAIWKFNLVPRVFPPTGAPGGGKMRGL